VGDKKNKVRFFKGELMSKADVCRIQCRILAVAILHHLRVRAGGHRAQQATAAFFFQFRT